MDGTDLRVLLIHEAPKECGPLLPELLPGLPDGVAEVPVLHALPRSLEMSHRVSLTLEQTRERLVDGLPEDEIGGLLRGPQTFEVVETVLLRTGEILAGLRVREVREGGGE